MYMMVCCVGVGRRGSRRGWQLFRMSMSAMIALWVCEPRVSLLEKALSYSARSAARPTRPKRCVVVKEHLPASLRACSGVIALVCRCVCSCVEICSTRSWQGEIVMFSASQLMSTPWILWDGSGGCRLDCFM